jgi:hypothetical protein
VMAKIFVFMGSLLFKTTIRCRANVPSERMFQEE